MRGWLWPPDAVLLHPHPSTSQGRPLENVSGPCALGRDAGEAEAEAEEEHDAQVDLFRDHIWPRLIDGAVAFAIGNSGKRHPKVAKAMKDEGVTDGVPDIYIIHRRQSYFLEMKKPRGGRVSKEQKAMMARLVGAGAICAVARGLDDAISQLEAWGLLVVRVAAEIEEMAA